MSLPRFRPTLSRTRLDSSLNSASVTGARLVSAGASWLLAIALARLLGAAGFGEYIVIVAIVQLVAVIADAGLNRVLIRDVAVDPELAEAYLRTVRRARFGLSLVGVGVALAVAQISGNAAGAALVFGAVGLIPLADARTSEGLLYAFGRIRRAAMLAAAFAIARFVLSFAAATLGFGVIGVLGAQSLAALFYAVSLRYGAPVANGSIGGPALSFRSLFRSSYSFAALAALEALYSRLDVFIIALVTGSPMQVGLYSGAYKLYEAATIPSASISAVQVPAYARRLARRDPTLRRAVVRAVIWSLVAGIGVAVVVAPNAQGILRLVYGPEYEGAAGALSALALAAIAGFVVYPIAALLAASHQQRSLLTRSIAQIGLNAVANVWLVAQFGITGAGIAMLVTTISGVLLYGTLARRMLNTDTD